jgi:hypothetical protein
MNSSRPGLNKARSAAEAEDAFGAADAFDTIATKLEGVQDFARLALRASSTGSAAGRGFGGARCDR